MQHLIVGGSGGIGGALIDELLAREGTQTIHATWHRNEPSREHSKLQWWQLDASSEDAVAAFADSLNSYGSSELHWLINCAGLLHDDHLQPEKSISAVSQNALLKSFTANSVPTLLLAKYFSAHLKHSQPAVFATVSAKVGSIADNRLGGWYSYRASKAALNMALKTLAIEWQRTHKNVCVAALHPGTTATALSAPFAKRVPAEQLFTSERTAHYLTSVVDALDSTLTGRFWAFDGEELPW